MARIARNMVGNKHPVAYFKLLNTISYLNNFSCSFMAEYQRGLVDTIPLHYITAADTTSQYLYQYFTRADLRSRHLL
jgi:hypothetical protein